MMSIDKIRELLGDQADALLNHTSTAITKDSLAILPSGNFVTVVVVAIVVVIVMISSSISSN